MLGKLQWGTCIQEIIHKKSLSYFYKIKKLAGIDKSLIKSANSFT